MRYKIIFVYLFLLLLFFINNSETQANEDDYWKGIIHIQGGFFGNGGAFTYKVSENYPYTGSLVEGSIELKYRTGLIFCGGFEISKGYFGLQGNFGMTTANMESALKISAFGYTLEEKEEANITTFYAEGAFLFFPTGSGVDKLSPYVTIGAGGCKMNGDRDDGGYLISYGGGVRIFFEKKWGLLIGLKGFIMDFGDIDGISGEELKLKIKPLQLTSGFIYCF